MDDIAKRHPEIAEHLGNFSQRDRQRPHFPEDHPGLRERFPRHFAGDRFEQFGFPFDRDSFDPEQYAQQFYQPQQNFHQQQQSSTPQDFASCNPNQQQEPPQQPQPSECHQAVQPETESRQNLPSTSEREKGNIQQSNTIDLGQKQEPEAINDRSQRSMSAPPAEKAQRFTSSIHIPVNQPQPNPSENMAQSQQHSETKSSNERIIPIHIEGRDEPVLPKNVPPEYVQQHSHPEKIFGQRPEQFTQFLNREPRFANNWHTGFPDEPMRQQRFHPQQNAFHQQPKEDIPIPVQKEVPVQKQQEQQQYQQPNHEHQQHQRPQAPQEPQEQPKLPTQQKPLTPIDQIQEIQKEVSSLLSQVEQFNGKYRDKQYLYLDEMLTRYMIKLDNIDTQGQDNIRSARKEAIKCIERAIGVLETKASGGNKAINENMEIEPITDTQPMEAENVEESPKQVEMESSIDQQPEAKKENVEDVPMKEETSENKNSAEETPSKVDNIEPTASEDDSNMSVNDAVKKFEGKTENIPDNVSNQEKQDLKSSSEQGAVEKQLDIVNTKEETSNENETKVDSDKDDKKEKKDKKKGKKKVENKEK